MEEDRSGTCEDPVISMPKSAVTRRALRSLSVFPSSSHSPLFQNNNNLLGDIQYFPTYDNQILGGIHLKYFPYYGNKAQQNYTQPFVAVKFLNATKDVDHMVECRVNAANINNQDSRDLFQGRVIFRLRINSP
ncbi:sodium/potassium-transporting ATPase subunit beta-2-like [Bufo gargarizans]|uniref:sodium/potassium-transporting ATPase subunit beta-2-like n=1 Tax=Bufo gargarizans TaxID=30331 RepID=UPI001CF319F6|nr:sodium/potassium-transporting ATPase subunit beta-2-like [Bufo gargarizans]